jgi:peptide/nickel transport system substrate-binding protein
MRCTSMIAQAAGVGLLLLSPAAMAQKSADTVRIGFSDPLSTVDSDFDPKPESSFVGKAVLDSLVYYSAEKGDFVPLLAESWKRIDDTTIEFKLRKDVKWHDGAPLTADDVVYTLNWIADPKTKFRFKDQVSFITGGEKVDQYTIRARSNAKSAIDLVRYAISVRIRPQHIMTKFDDPSDFGRKNPVGTGMFRATQVNANTGIVLEKNADFPQGGPGGIAAHVGKIHVLPIPDSQTQTAQLLTGGLDVALDLPKDQAEQLAKDARFTSTATQALVFFYINFDSAGRSKLKVFTDQRVRKAVSMAIDRDALVHGVISGGSEVRKVDALCFRVQQGCDFTTKPPAYDPAAAKKLLAEAGYPNGFDLVLSSLEGAHEVSEAVAGQLRAVGIRASVRRHTFGTYRKAQVEGDQEALLGRYSSGGMPDTSAITSFYFGGSPRDYTHDPILDKLDGAGEVELDPAKRKEIYRQAMDRVNEMDYVLPIATNPAVFVHTRDIVIKKGSLNNFGIEASDISWR